jgi:hypothetical protein
MVVFKSGLIIVCLAAFASDAVAQVPCTNRADLLKVLSNKYKEGPVNLGTANGKNLVEVYASEKGTFTIIATQPNGISCIIAAGQDWEAIGPPPKNLTSL